MKCPRCGFNPDPVNEPEYSDAVCGACEDDDRSLGAYEIDEGVDDGPCSHVINGDTCESCGRVFDDADLEDLHRSSM